MINVGEQLVSSYLRHIKGCEFVDTNVYTTAVQGEIDVIGLNQKEEQLYVCEVAIHLTTGLQYVGSDNKTNNIEKLTDKFSKDIEYARTHWARHNHHFMLWSPKVTNSQGKLENNQIHHLKEIQANINATYGEDIECIVNKRFLECLGELRSYAQKETKPLQCPVMRYLQIEEYLQKHVAKLG